MRYKTRINIYKTVRFREHDVQKLREINIAENSSNVLNKYKEQQSHRHDMTCLGK